MPYGSPAHYEILALCACKQTLARLLPALKVRGHTLDVVTDLAAGRASFLKRGGHGVLLVAQDATPGMAATLVADLRAIAPDLRVLGYGVESIGKEKVERMPAFHPSARASIVAVLHALQT